MTAPAIRNLTIHQNTDWSESFSFEIDGVPMQLEGYTFVGKCRKGEDASSDLMFNFTFNRSGNNVTVSVAASVTAALNLSNEPDQCQYWFDWVMIDPSNKRTKFLAGRVTIERTVSS